MKRLIVFSMIAALLVPVLPAFGGGIDNPSVPIGPTLHRNIAQLGMGGMSTVIRENAHTPFYNPALLSQQNFRLELDLIAVGVNQEVPGLVQFISDNAENFGQMDQMSQDEQDEFYDKALEYDNKFIPTQIMPYIGFAFKNFGFGVYNVSQTDVAVDLGVLAPSVRLRGYMDTVVGVGYGRFVQIRDFQFQAGATVKVVDRRVVNAERVTADEVSATDELFNTMLDELNQSYGSVGIDLGVAKTFEMGEPGHGTPLDVGVTLQDLFMDLGDGMMIPNLKAGVMYHLPWADESWLARWVVGGEVVDMFNREGNSLFNKINLGTELAVLKGFLRLRGGFHQGYPTGGLGLSFGIMTLDYAYFTRELGPSPDTEPESMHRIQLGFGWQ
ncbi:hypothetical protein GF324_08400 [bacterium]|nr:hypothetical protein [bacterium]